MLSAERDTSSLRVVQRHSAWYPGAKLTTSAAIGRSVVLHAATRTRKIVAVAKEAAHVAVVRIELVALEHQQ